MLKFFTVHCNESLADPDQRIVLVKEGFSWAAFALPVLWLVYNRAWLGLPLYAAAAAGLLLLYFLTGQSELMRQVILGSLLIGFPLGLAFTPDPAVALPCLLFAALCGYEALDIRRAMLARRHYRMQDVVAGRNQLDAERAYFSERPLPGPAAAAGSDMAARKAGLWARAGEPILGLFAGPDRRPDWRPDWRP